MNPPVKPGPDELESGALVRRTRRWLIAGLCLSVANATALACLANARVAREVAVLMVLGLLAGGFSSAAGACLYYFGLPPATRAALPSSAQGLARAGTVAALGTGLLVGLVVLFAAGSMK
jgi:hypothetical protein